MTWKPIDTAPRDGQTILAVGKGLSPMVLYWSEWLEAHWQPLGQPWRDVTPSHWLPMPKPPSLA